MQMLALLKECLRAGCSIEAIVEQYTEKTFIVTMGRVWMVPMTDHDTIPIFFY